MRARKEAGVTYVCSIAPKLNILGDPKEKGVYFCSLFGILGGDDPIPTWGWVGIGEHNVVAGMWDG